MSSIFFWTTGWSVSQREYGGFFPYQHGATEWPLVEQHLTSSQIGKRFTSCKYFFSHRKIHRCQRMQPYNLHTKALNHNFFLGLSESWVISSMVWKFDLSKSFFFFPLLVVFHVGLILQSGSIINIIKVLGCCFQMVGCRWWVPCRYELCKWRT